MSGAVRVEQDGAIAVLTMDVPERLNAMSPAMAAEFSEAVAGLQRDGEVRAVIVTGSGRAFSAGGDLSMIEEHLDWTPEDNRRFMGAYYRAFLSVLHLDVPTIAAINGHAIGAGLSMALGCDMRVAAEHARLGVTYVNLGLHPGMGTTHLLPQVVGYANAADLIFTGRVVNGQEALAMGLVSRVVGSDQLMPVCLDIAREIATKPASGVRMAKRALVSQKLAGLEAALDYEATAQMSSFASADMRAAVAALRARETRG